MPVKREKIIMQSHRGYNKESKSKNGSVKVKLVWNDSQFSKRNKNFVSAQEYVDSSILRLTKPYTPLLTGLLVASATLYTVVGSGLIIWNTPYARRQYYSTTPIGRETGALRGNRWFSRMKADRGQEIIRGAKKIAGKG